jgi:hypothetical protein
MRSVALAGIFTVGIGLLLASALLALSAWLGPIAATGVAGCTFLVAGGLLSLVRRRHPDREAETVPLPTPLDPAKGGLALPILGLGLGLALSTLLVRRPN